MTRYYFINKLDDSIMHMFKTAPAGGSDASGNGDTVSYLLTTAKPLGNLRDCIAYMLSRRPEYSGESDRLLGLDEPRGRFGGHGYDRWLACHTEGTRRLAQYIDDHYEGDVGRFCSDVNELNVSVMRLALVGSGQWIEEMPLRCSIFSDSLAANDVLNGRSLGMMEAARSQSETAYRAHRKALCFDSDLNWFVGGGLEAEARAAEPQQVAQAA